VSKPLKVKNVLAADPIEQTAAKILRTRLKEYYSHWPDPRATLTLEQLHNMRISGKRMRYSAEQLRDLFDDRLALLMELLKRGQDLLGEIQDCVTQGAMIEAELARIERRKPTEAAALKRLIHECGRRRRSLLAQFRNIWMGMAAPEFRASLKAMVSKS
jgi:CHAD domain-containing protein